jgi:chromosomal replication initiator protein
VKSDSEQGTPNQPTAPEQLVQQLRSLAIQREIHLSTDAIVPVMQVIIGSVALAFGLAPADITGRSRMKSVAEARAVACYVARRCTRMSFPEIGRAVDRDHTTVMTAVKMVTARRLRDRWTDAACAVLLDQFGEIEESRAQ